MRKYLTAAAGGVLLWLVVAVIVGFGLAWLFPPEGGRLYLGFNGRTFGNWRGIAGVVLGLAVGVLSARASLQRGGR